MQLTVEQRLIKNTSSLSVHEHTMLYASILRFGKVVVDDDCPTACTNGVDVIYGRKFCEDMSDAKLRGLMLHENLHKAFKHFIIYQDLVKKFGHHIVNCAEDYNINLIIHDLDESTNGYVKLPDGALLDEKYRGTSIHDICRDLKQQQEDDPQSGSGIGDLQTLDAHDWESAEGMSAEEKDEIAKEISQAIFEGNILCGKKAGKTNRDLSDSVKPKVTLKDVLKQFVSGLVKGGDEPSYSRPNRRKQYADDDFVFPTYMKPQLGRGIFAFDMSGSISSDDAKQSLAIGMNAFAETVPESVDIMYWDTEVHRHEHYDPSEYHTIQNKTKPMGGGGTDVQCVVDYIKTHKIQYDFIVVFTDGYVDGWGSGWQTDKILWVISEGGSHAVPTVGKHFRIGD
jgi:predicted metal-dependent peptidase